MRGAPVERRLLDRQLSYEEFIYYVVGKTKEQARIALPKTISDTHTTEIFRWENNKWFY